VRSAGLAVQHKQRTVATDTSKQPDAKRKPGCGGSVRLSSYLLVQIANECPVQSFSHSVTTPQSLRMA